MKVFPDRPNTVCRHERCARLGIRLPESTAQIPLNVAKRRRTDPKVLQRRVASQREERNVKGGRGARRHRPYAAQRLRRDAPVAHGARDRGWVVWESLEPRAADGAQPLQARSDKLCDTDDGGMLCLRNGNEEPRLRALEYLHERYLRPQLKRRTHTRVGLS